MWSGMAHGSATTKLMWGWGGAPPPPPPAGEAQPAGPGCNDPLPEVEGAGGDPASSRWDRAVQASR
eukprot:6510798-Alexandrium_andersonii.AAC.1